MSRYERKTLLGNFISVRVERLEWANPDSGIASAIQGYKITPFQKSDDESVLIFADDIPSVLAVIQADVEERSREMIRRFEIASIERRNKAH